jgi:protein O-mannosyl-transferase
VAPHRSEPANATTWRQTAGTALVLIAAGMLAYANSLHAPFVFDDSVMIEQNPYITRLWPIQEAMRAPVQSAGAGRPLVSLSLAISYAQGGLSPAAFRAWNIGVLIVSALLLFGIVRRTFLAVRDDPGGAWQVGTVVALIWLVHPLQTEVVGYVTQRTESMMGLFYLLTVYCAIRCMEEGPRAARWGVTSVVACAAGMACKEVMVTAPVAVLLYDATFRAKSFTAALRRRRALYGGLAATWIVLAFLISGAPRSRSAGFGTGISPWAYLLNQVVMICTYLRLSVWPDPLILDYGPTRPIAFVGALPYGLAVNLLVLLVVVAWVRGYRTFAFLGTCFFLTLAPSSSIVPIATEVGAERRMYLALALVLTAIVLGVRAAAARWPPGTWVRRPATAWGATALVATLLIAVTIARNRDFANPVSLWEGVLAHRSDGRAHYNLAISLRAAGRVDEAMTHYRAAVAEEPAALYAIGFELGRAGQHDEAERQLAEYVKRLPDGEQVPRASFLRGQSLVRLGRPLDAEQAFRATIRMTPRNPDAHIALAELLASQNRHADAIPSYRAYLAMMPASAEALQGLGLALYATGKGGEAVDAFQKAVAIRSADPGVRMNLGNALAAEGRLQEAIEQYRIGRTLAPSNATLMSALALALAASGERDEPLALFARARELAPNDPNVQSDYETALRYWRRR